MDMISSLETTAFNTTNRGAECPDARFPCPRFSVFSTRPAKTRGRGTFMVAGETIKLPSKMK